MKNEPTAVRRYIDASGKKQQQSGSNQGRGATNASGPLSLNGRPRILLVHLCGFGFLLALMTDEDRIDLIRENVSQCARNKHVSPTSVQLIPLFLSQLDAARQRVAELEAQIAAFTDTPPKANAFEWAWHAKSIEVERDKLQQQRNEAIQDADHWCDQARRLEKTVARLEQRVAELEAEFLNASEGYSELRVKFAELQQHNADLRRVGDALLGEAQFFSNERIETLLKNWQRLTQREGE